MRRPSPAAGSLPVRCGSGWLSAPQPPRSQSHLWGRRQVPELRCHLVPLPYKFGSALAEAAEAAAAPGPADPEQRIPSLQPGAGLARAAPRTMGGCEFLLLGKPRSLLSLGLFALVLLEVHWGAAAPLQSNGGASPLAKIYPRGSHWAVGHLMGKKSTGDFPYVYEEENKIPFSALPENVKQLGDYLQWEETLKNLLRLLEENENRSAQTLREELPWYTKNTWETDDDSSFKDMMDYLLQVMNRKESSPS
ncbi:unnamed protein product [Eretmochelys imbricata]